MTKSLLNITVEMYKNGVRSWHKDKEFLIDCAYYEGRISKACEVLNIPVPYSHINKEKCQSSQLINSYTFGYNSWN
jgi:hypothetical protein